MPTLEPNTNAKKSASIISLADYLEHRFRHETTTRRLRQARWRRDRLS